MKVLLLVPPTAITLSHITTSSSMPHIGLAYVAAYLKEKGIEVKVIDAPIENITFRNIRKHIKRINPDIIGITANTMQIKEANKTAGIIKIMDDDIPTIIGGYHATALPKQTLEEFQFFDYAVYCEGEITTYELVKRLENSKDVSDIDSIAYRKNNRVIVTKQRNYIKNLDDIPFPAFDLFPIRKYTPFYSNLKNIIELPIATSRGCPYQCTFCSRPLGNIVRYRSIENIISEIKRDLDEFNIKQLHFVDETFILDRRRIITLCNRLIHEKINTQINWICETRIDKIDRGLLKKMKEAGCSIISYGVESGNDEILSKTKKGITTSQIKESIKLSKDIGLKVVANFIMGLPYETKETILDTINFALDVDPDFAIFGILTPFPGTMILDMAKEGKGNLQLLTSDWEKYDKHVGGALSLKDLNRNELESLQTLAYKRFYLRHNRISNLFKIINIKTIPIYILHRFKTMINDIFRTNK